MSEEEQKYMINFFEVAGGGRTGVMALEEVPGGGNENASRFLLQIETADLKFNFSLYLGFLL